MDNRQFWMDRRALLGAGGSLLALAACGRNGGRSAQGGAISDSQAEVLLKALQEAPSHGFLPTDHRIYGFIVLALIPLVIFFYRHRPDVATTAYVTASLIITLSSSLGPRPRFLLAAFPLLLPVAQRWTGLRHQALVATGFGLLGLSLVYYAAGGPLAIEHFNFNGPVP